LNNRYRFTPPSNPLLKWLTSPGPSVPDHIRDVLLGELFSSPTAVLMGILNGVILNIVALFSNSESFFFLFLIVDVALATTRYLVLRRASRLAALGLPTPTDLCLIMAVIWCGLQGVMAFAFMITNIPSLQVLSALTVMAFTGPICARNYAAPRFAFTLICLYNLPFAAGCAFSGDQWLLVTLIQTPIFLYGCTQILSRFQIMAVRTLQAEYKSNQDARRDSLTKLLNRPGLAEFLSSASGQYALFYLDLDGFKQVNDAYGHLNGDKVLIEVAHRLMSRTRSNDIIARMGGDEFVIVAPNMPASEAEAFAEKIILRITETPYELDNGQSAHIGISIGFASYPDDSLMPEELLSKADAALYEVKHNGKGRYRRFMRVCNTTPPEQKVA
jgi:diguanylate cyclase (GGDEF)-like protein